MVEGHGKEGPGGRYLGLQDVIDLFENRKIPERMNKRLRARSYAPGHNADPLDPLNRHLQGQARCARCSRPEPTRSERVDRLDTCPSEMRVGLTNEQFDVWPADCRPCRMLVSAEVGVPMRHLIRRIASNASIFVASVACLPGLAAATTVSYSGSLSSAGVIHLDQFDASLGTLQNVTFLSDFISSAVFYQVVYIGTVTAAGQVTAGTQFGLGTIGGFPLDSVDAVRGCSSDFVLYTCAVTAIASGNHTDVATDLVTLGLFTGSGSIDVEYVNQITPRVGDVGPFFYSAHATVIYDYADAPTIAVPEPSSLALAGLAALLAIGARPMQQRFRHRRTK